MVRVQIFPNSAHWELQYDKKSALNWRWGRCSLNRLKTIFLRLKLLERVGNFVCLILCCSVSTLSRWPLTLTNQKISTRLPLISTEKLPINENNLQQYSSKSKSFLFLLNASSISSEILSKLHPRKTSFSQPNPLALVERIYISPKKTMW